MHIFISHHLTEGTMNWQDVCEHSSLQNLPFKIELNEQGKILMSPVKVYHSAYQGEIIRLMPKEESVCEL